MAIFGNFGQQPTGMMLVPVTGESTVNTYPVAAGMTVAFVDFGNNQMWLKSTGANAIPQPIRKFELKEIADVIPAQGVSREEFDELKAEMKKLIDALGGNKNE